MTRHLAAVAAAAALGLAACAAGPHAARNDQLFERIQPGMTEHEVRALVGPPDETMPFPLSRTTSWDYQYQDTWGYMVVFSVTFGPDGRAVGRIARRVNDGGDHS